MFVHSQLCKEVAYITMLITGLISSLRTQIGIFWINNPSTPYDLIHTTIIAGNTSKDHILQ